MGTDSRSLCANNSRNVLYNENLSIDEKLTYFVNICLTDEFWEKFHGFAYALRDYVNNPSQQTIEMLFKQFQFHKDAIKSYDSSIYYGMLSWKDSNLKYVRHLILEA